MTLPIAPEKFDQEAINEAASTANRWLPIVCHILVDQWQISSQSAAQLTCLSETVFMKAANGLSPQLVSDEVVIRCQSILETHKLLTDTFKSAPAIRAWFEQTMINEEQSIKQGLNTLAFPLLQDIRTLAETWKL